MAAIDTARTAPKPKATQTSQSSYLDAAKPTPKPTRTTAPIPEPTKIAAAPIVAAGGNFVVQLAAVQDKSAIDTEWKKAFSVDLDGPQLVLNHPGFVYKVITCYTFTAASFIP